MLLVICWILASFLCAFVAGQKGRSAVAWWFLSLVFTPVLVLIALCAVPNVQRRDTKKEDSPAYSSGVVFQRF